MGEKQLQEEYVPCFTSCAKICQKIKFLSVVNVELQYVTGACFLECFC